MAVQLKASAREKGKAKNLVKVGKIPAIVYGPNRENLEIQLLQGEIESLISKAKETTPVRLTVDLNGSTEERNVFVKSVQFHKVNGKIIHVDLYEPDPAKPMRFKMPVELSGESEGVKAGGILDVLLRDVEGEALPSNIIEEIKIDISSMKIGDSLRVKDLKIPEGVKILHDPEDVIATIKAPRAEEVAAPAPAESAETSEPEAIKTKGKKEEEAEAEEK
ncbi:50S ribosomal protein L25 [Athalassotoga saccharophila]|uniref:50S ribosomal protein L25 n=1 Tax=Athalassotoga saccharophila TaxID=1441386 RepID=UPI00137B2D24|nr:50S ribosomal protein L25 [Athalassotoga saccharophila]BBJ28231.1 50S ribosomal protein L25 [Athalassotoga saccharophila]